MKRSEKIIIGILTLGLIAALCIGGTMAYMTDWEDKENTFTVGTLDVALEEKNWDAGEGGENVVPGDTFEKDPVIKGVKNDSYVRARIVFKDSAGKVITDSERLALIRSMIRFDSTYDADAQKNGTVVVPGESYSLADIAALPMINPAFTEVATGKAGEYCYTYNSVLAEGENVALFTNVVVPTDWSQIQLDAAGAFKIDVTVEAIQAKNFENAAAAFSALDSEISAGTIVHNYDSTN
jgi:predicted ribosomally synthesized peptide with SipW-like signal peptide